MSFSACFFFPQSIRNTYVTPKPVDCIDKVKMTGQSTYEIALDVSRFDVVKLDLDKPQYEPAKTYWDNTQKLPPPPSLPGNNESVDRNLSDNNPKELNINKQIDLPTQDENENDLASNINKMVDTFSDDNSNENPHYARCNFDSKSKVEISDN